MSAVCENFVQNAWKKDLCSNCFKLKQDHSIHVCSSTPTMDVFNECYTPHVTTVYHTQSTPISTTWKGLALQKHFGNNGYLVNGLALADDDNGNDYGRLRICNGKVVTESSDGDSNSDEEKIDNLPVGILKSGQRKASTGSVGFREEDPQVIGYGGELESEREDNSPEEESDDCNDCDSLENFDASEDEKEFSRLTERNTEFNSLNRNLLVVAEKTTQSSLLAKNNSGDSSSAQEVISKPVEEEKSGANRFQLPRATIRPFCRESVSSILDAKVNAPSPEVHYDENGHVVIIEMSAASPATRDKECVAYEVSPLSNVVATDLKIRSGDSPPDLPANPPPDETEQPLGKVDDFGTSNLSIKVKIAPANVSNIGNNGNPDVIPQPDHDTPPKKDFEMHYSSSAILKGLPESPQMTNHYSCAIVSQELTNVVISPKPVKIKPKVPSKPKLSPDLSAEREEAIGDRITSNIDSDSSSQSTSEEIYQDTSEAQNEVTLPEDKRELTFRDKVANLASNLDFNRKSTKRLAPQPPSPQLAVENIRAFDEKSSPTPVGNETPPSAQLAVLLRNPMRRAITVANASACSTNLREDGEEVGKESLIVEQIEETTSPTPPRKPLSPVVAKKSGLFSSNAKVRTCHSLDISSSKILSTPMSEDCKDNRKFKGKFSFKKFLKFGKDGEEGTRCKSSPYSSSTLDKRMKLEIIHPMDLANVPPSGSSPDWEPELTSYEVKMDPGSPRDQTQSWSTRIKPPPPPRIKNGEQNVQKESGCKPMRPPPPSKIHTYSANNIASHVQTPPFHREKIEVKTDDVKVVRDESPSGGGEYANLGDVRIVLVPKKPERSSPGCTRKENCGEAGVKNTSNASSDPTYSEPDDSIVNPAQDEKSDVSTIRATNPTTKISHHSRRAKAAGMVFMDSGFGDSSSGESDVASISSGEAQPQTTTSPNPDLSNLYAEVIRKAKKTSKPRQMIPTDQTDRHHDVAPPLPPVIRRSESSSTDCENVSSDNGGGCNDRESSPEMMMAAVTAVGVTPEIVNCSTATPPVRRKKLNLRPNRSVIHRNLEENYGAVITANHEALAHLVEQVSSDKNSDASYALKDASLRWSNFKVQSTPVAKVQNIAFYDASWDSRMEVTLMVSEDIFPIPIPAKAPFLLSPLATFHDIIPSQFVDGTTEQIPRMIWIFPRIRVQTLPDFSRNLRTLVEEDAEQFANVVCFLTFQLVSALKYLQSQGTEEVGYPPTWIVMMGNDQNCIDLRLSLIGGTMQTFPHPDADYYSLCKSASLVMHLLLTGKENSIASADVFQCLPKNSSCKNVLQIVAEMLEREKTSSLSRVNCILEYSLFGPADLPLDGRNSCRDQEMALQRWLDLERATVLNAMIRSKSSKYSELSIFEEYHVSFLIRTNARSLNEAANLVRQRLTSSVA